MTPMKVGDLFNFAVGQSLHEWLSYCSACRRWTTHETRYVDHPDFTDGTPERIVACQNCRYISRVTEAA